ncbi:TCR/Tet family MFS transporter [Hyphobacterium marinum]|uniref:TCR/Tet family MFS transporter n=1 Tax=Hyphobacterium marinum TaxID=3116574 RepID=A0ABU7LV51_9PROT|nr:TCR/Tet family MFS transporter [Hyphobacterium sp. Y6023]MEE2565439.1 TCR/Tet family MFS transporter [Hyphobacterium sp. Y6023]
MIDRKPGKHALAFIFITVLLDMIGLGIILPVMPDLIMDITGLTLPQAARWGGAIYALYALTQFIFAPVVGNLSDRFGRRPVLLVAIAGFAIDYLVMGFAPVLWVLFIGRALSGMFGATYSTAGAYIADITPPEERGGRFGLIGAAFGLGFIIGPAIGGPLGDIDHRLPFFVAAGLAGVNFIYGFLVLPETHKEENRRPFRWANANPVGALMQLKQFPMVFGLLAAVALFYIGHAAFPAVWAYYGPEKFGWSNAEVGLSLAAVGVVSAIVQGGLSGRIIKAWGQRNAAIVGFAVATAAYFAYAFAPNTAAVYVIIALAGISGVAGPALQSIMSGQVPADMQGALQGGVTSLGSLMMAFSPILMTQIFFAFSNREAEPYFPGAPYFLAGLLTVVAVIIIVWATRPPGPVPVPAD